MLLKRGRQWQHAMLFRNLNMSFSNIKTLRDVQVTHAMCTNTLSLMKLMPKINKDELCSFICHLCLSYYCTTQFCCYHIHFLAHLCCTSFKSHCFSVILPATLSFVQSISSSPPPASRLKENLPTS